MEEMISKVSAGIEKAKADIIAVIDENHYGQSSQANRLEGDRIPQSVQPY